MDPSHVWLPELVERIASFLHSNDTSCTLRFVNKATALQFRGRPQHTTVRLSQPVPPHAFARKWAAPGAMRQLTLKQRHRLLRLTAASGVVTNMEVALASVGFLPTKEQEEQVLVAAAGAGRLEVCDWLLRRTYAVSKQATHAAARSGQRAVCELLLAHAECSADMLCDAARGGHPELMEWLLQRLHQRRAQEGPGPASPESPSPDAVQCLRNLEFISLLANAATGCDLPTLQSVYRRCLGAQCSEVDPSSVAGVMLANAAGSPSPDWRGKVEWLEPLAPPDRKQDPYVCETAAAASDAVSRVTWLRQRGYAVSITPVELYFAAVEHNVSLLEYAKSAGTDMALIREAVLRYGRAQSLPEHFRDELDLKFSDAAMAVDAAAERGDLSLLQWAVEHLGASVPSGDHEADAARMARVARRGNAEMLAWMHERGCPFDAATFTAAAKGGCEAALEWLAQRGCPMEGHKDAYLRAARNGDLATLRCLRRLGCPWGPDGKVFTACIAEGCSLPVLRWLAEAGCPVDWGEAARTAATRSFNFCPMDVRSWVVERWEQEQELQERQQRAA